MRQIFNILIITLFFNFFMLSFGYGQQNGVNVMGVVPETELNSRAGHIEVKQAENEPVFKENKYLYFFEKALGLSLAAESGEANQAQTNYDSIASKLLLWAILLLFAVILWLILRFFDSLVFGRRWRVNRKRS